MYAAWRWFATYYLRRAFITPVAVTRTLITCFHAELKFSAKIDPPAIVREHQTTAINRAHAQGVVWCIVSNTVLSMYR